jgi:dipeptidyl aminopeptidase/acylaminoacyl peptidase
MLASITCQERFQHRGHRGHGERIRQLCQFSLTSRYALNCYLPRLLALPFLLATIFLFFANCAAQENPAFKIDDNLTRFAFFSGGRIAYSTRHVYSVKKIQLQRDDVWIAEADGKKRRILLGEKFVRGTGPFSYTVRGLRWSPDGSKLAVELGTSEMINDDGDTREGVMTLLLDDTGREITIPGADSVIPGAVDAAWMTDGASVVYLTENTRGDGKAAGAAAKASAKATAADASENPTERPAPVKLFTMNRVKPFAEGVSALFQGRLFSAVAWNTKQDGGVGVEREAGAKEISRLVLLDLPPENSRELGILEGFAGGLSISPSGRKVAYWIDNERLEIREIDSPNRMARVRVALGTLAWSADETRVLVKRGAALRSGGLAWVTLPQLVTVGAGAAPATVEVAPRTILHELEFRQFDISPDGKFLGVVEPGKRNLLVYPVL